MQTSLKTTMTTYGLEIRKSTYVRMAIIYHLCPFNYVVRFYKTYGSPRLVLDRLEVKDYKVVGVTNMQMRSGHYLYCIPQPIDVL